MVPLDDERVVVVMARWLVRWEKVRRSEVRW